MADLIAARRDASFNVSPSGHGRNPRPSRMHAIILRKDGSRGPACGIQFHDDSTEEPASALLESEKCTRPGCRAAFAAEQEKTDG